jgi:DNA repair exonuclease SbcCD ATPase subunit
MGFLDGLLGKKDVEVRIERMRMSELPNWVAREKRDLKEGKGEKESALLKKIMESVDGLMPLLESLGESEIEKDVQQRIKTIVASSRDNYVSKIKRLLEGLNLEANEITLSEELGDTLDKIKKLDLKYGERIRFGFEDELNKVRKALNGLVSLSGELDNLVGERKRKLQLGKKIEKEMAKYEALEKEITELKSRESKVVAEMEEKKQSKETTLKGMDAIEHSDRAEKLCAMKLELESLEEKKKTIETLILNILGPLKRIFKKYAKAISEGKASGINVGKYANDPAGTYLWGEHTLPDLLAKIQKAIQTGVLELDGVEADKTLKKIRAISFAYLEKSRAEYNTVTSRIRTLEKQVGDLDVSKEIEKLQREADNIQKRIESDSESVKRAEEEIDEKRSNMKELEASLSKLLSEYSNCTVELL